ncbi:thaumatin family protein [Sporobolomyces salmoneus]|uniref:thaumatin family protein n=1 Tax=Sporobolomyces salmoneus TaxID=183962 RepID=UPI00317140A6
MFKLHSLSLLLIAPLVLSKSLIVTNNCPYTVWPVISNTNIGGGYTGMRGWEAPPGDFHVAEIPSVWNGRIWARRGCSFDENGNGDCLAGGCPNGALECGDQMMGKEGNLVEMNLNDQRGGLDWYDISAVPGFILPITLVPGDSKCESVHCTKDLNPTCPDDRLKVIDNGETIACKSACFAGVNAGDNSANCCSGSFLSHEACKPEMVDFYSFFKDGCPAAYAYPRDEDPTNVRPRVVFTCDTSVPWYRITFCGQ